MCTQATEAPTSDMQDPMSLIQSVNQKVEALRSDLDTNVSSIRDGSVFSNRSFSSVLSGINFFETCQTSIESNCTIRPETPPALRAPAPCITNPVPLNMVNNY